MKFVEKGQDKNKEKKYFCVSFVEWLLVVKFDKRGLICKYIIMRELFLKILVSIKIICFPPSN